MSILTWILVTWLMPIIPLPTSISLHQYDEAKHSMCKSGELLLTVNKPLLFPDTAPEDVFVDSLIEAEAIDVIDEEEVKDFLHAEGPDARKNRHYCAALIHFKGRHVTSEEAIQGLRKIGLTPANASHLIALGDHQDELEADTLIVALGEISTRLTQRDGPIVLSMYMNEYGGGIMRPERWGTRWPPNTRFLAIFDDR